MEMVCMIEQGKSSHHPVTSVPQQSHIVFYWHCPHFTCFHFNSYLISQSQQQLSALDDEPLNFKLSIVLGSAGIFPLTVSGSILPGSGWSSAVR